MSERIQVEGDVHKVAPTRKHFAALIAVTKTAEECARLIEFDLARVTRERDIAIEALERIGGISNAAAGDGMAALDARSTLARIREGPA